MTTAFDVGFAIGGVIMECIMLGLILFGGYTLLGRIINRVCMGHHDTQQNEEEK